MTTEPIDNGELRFFRQTPDLDLTQAFNVSDSELHAMALQDFLATRAIKLDFNLVILSPGKFESEPWYVVRAWEYVLDGDGDTYTIEGRLHTLLTLSPGECAEFGVPRASTLYLHETDSGFVNSRLLTEAQRVKLASEFSAMQESESEESEDVEGSELFDGAND